MELTKIQKLAIKDQKKVIQQCVDDLKHRGVAVLSGGAGYGKSYCARKIVEKYCSKNQNVVITTLSHKALKVASEFMEGLSFDFKAYTNASATNAKKVTDPDGTTYFVPKEKYKWVKGKKIIIPPPISKADFIPWDECSQASHEAINLVSKLKKPKAVILYIGDIAQLPPVGSDKLSPVFTDYEVRELKYPFRYEGENAEVANFMRKNILNGVYGKEYDPLCWKQFIGLNYSDFKMLNGSDLDDRKYFNEEMIAHFKKDEYMTKYIAYHNWQIYDVAKHIRKFLRNSYYDWEVGDRIMSKTTYYRDNILKIQNSQEETITGKRKLTLACIWVKEIDGSKRFFTLHSDKYKNVSSLKYYYSQLTNIAADRFIIDEVDYWSHDIGNQKFIPTKAFYPNWPKKTINDIYKYGIHHSSPCKHRGQAKDMVEEFFCDIQYAYALTSHKAQGSTYNYVFSSLKDIYSNNKISALEKLQSAYVAITRAKYKNFVLY